MSCRDCVFKSLYQDMGASFDVCSLHDYLPDAARACDNSESCQYRLTVQEAKEIVIKGADFLRDRDVVEVVHGSFVWIGDDSPMCNICGKVFDVDDNADAGLWKFCPECGAKMDGRRDQNEG